MCKDKTKIDDRDVIYQDYKNLDLTHLTDNLDYPKEFQQYLKFVRSKMYGKDVRESIARLAQITYKYTEATNNSNSKEITYLKEKLIKEFEEEITKLNKIFDALKDKYQKDVKELLESALSSLKNQNTKDFEKFKSEISKVNAPAELIEARSGKESLKKYLDLITFLENGKLHSLFPYIGIYESFKKHLFAFESNLENAGFNFPPNGKYLGMSVAQSKNFLTLFSKTIKDTELKNAFDENIFRFFKTLRWI